MPIDPALLHRLSDLTRHARGAIARTLAAAAPAPAVTLNTTHAAGDVVHDLVTGEEVTIVEANHTHTLVPTPHTSLE